MKHLLQSTEINRLCAAKDAAHPKKLLTQGTRDLQLSLSLLSICISGLYNTCALEWILRKVQADYVPSTKWK